MDDSHARLQFALTLLQKAKVEERIAGAAELVELAHLPELSDELRARARSLLDDPQPELRAAACAILGGLATDVVQLLERPAQDPEAQVRREALRALAGLEERAASGLLTAALKDPDAQVRFEAAQGLALLGDRAGVDELLANVDDKVRRFGALGALARLGEARARPHALAILNKRFFISDFEKTQAAGVLARLGDAEGRGYLLERIARTRADDRGLAMELCGEHQLTDALPALRKAMADPRELFRGTAARSLGLLHDAESVSPLIALARDGSVELGIRCDAIEGLMFLRTPEALSALHALSTDADEELRGAANDALAWLQRHPGDPA